MNNTFKSTLAVLLCSLGLTACNTTHPRNVSTTATVFIGIGGHAYRGHKHYRHRHGRHTHTHRHVRAHSHHKPHRSKPVKYGRPVRGHNTRPHRGHHGKHRPYFKGRS